MQLWMPPSKNNRLLLQNEIGHAQWVRNSHVRATNRNAEITICDGAMGSIIGGSLVYAAAVKVLDLLLSGKRVVCCSSTRKFTEILETFIAESKPDALVKVYNAATAAGTDTPC
jgi:methionine synthase I (cobalamin-dependent)